MNIAPISAPMHTAWVQRGPYHMVLAQFALRHPELAAHYRSAGRMGVDTIILDNGAYEGEELHHAALNKAIGIIEPDVVVLPDDPSDPHKTLSKSWEFLQTRPEIEAVMFVPHGYTVTEFEECLQAWINTWSRHPKAREIAEGYKLWIGVPGFRNIEDMTRGRVAHLLDIGLPLHLLGVHSITELLDVDVQAFTDNPLNAAGVDTSFPYVTAAHGELVTRHTPKRELGDIKQYVDLAEPALRLARLNTLLMRDWIEKGEASEIIPLQYCWQVVAGFGSYGMSLPQEVFFDPGLALKLAGVPSGIYTAFKVNRDDRVWRYAYPYQAEVTYEGYSIKSYEVVQNPYRR